MFNDIANNTLLQKMLSRETLQDVFVALAILVAGFILIRLIVVLVRRLTSRRFSRQSRMVMDKMITYSGMTVLIIIVLAELGVNLAALLGAAGVVGIALGVASQKSLGNMVSGIFLLSERPFEVGDVVNVDNVTGIVQDVDLLALKVRTFDNRMVRVPNETLISSTVINITRYPLRRMDFHLSVSYGDDLDRVEEVLKQVATDNPLVLDEPEPLFLFREYGASGLELLLGVWFLKDNYVEVKNSVFRGIYAGLRDAGYTIPFMQVVVHNPGKNGVTDDT